MRAVGGRKGALPDLRAALGPDKFAEATAGLGPDGLRRDDPALLKALRSDCNRQLAARPGSRPDERLAGVALVEPFTIENGLLTQTLKQRRDRIATRDAAAIEAIYAEG